MAQESFKFKSWKMVKCIMPFSIIDNDIITYPNTAEKEG